MMLAACLAIAFAPINVKEIVVESASSVSATIVVKAPMLSHRDLASWFVLGESMLAGTRAYTPRALIEFGAQSGRAPEVRTWADSMTIQVSAPAGDEGLSVATSIALSLATEPSLEDADINAAREICESRQSNRLMRAFVPYDLPWPEATPSAVRKLYAKTFTRNALQAVLWGKFSANKGREEVEASAADWNPRPAAYDQDPTGLRPDSKYRGDVTSLEVRGPQLSSADEIASGLIALAGLGGGKSGALFQQIRQKERWSYTQEAYIQPGFAGLTPRLIVLFKSTETNRDRAEALKATLNRAVDAWGDVDLARMKAMARGALAGNPVWSPFLLSPSRQPGQNEFDLAAIETALAISSATTAEHVREQIEKADLPTIQAAAKKILQGSIVQVTGQSAQ